MIPMQGGAPVFKKWPTLYVKPLSGKNDQLYKILWSGVNEPNKLEKTKGEIFLLLRSTDADGIEEGDPRLYAVEYNPLLLEKIMEIKDRYPNLT